MQLLPLDQLGAIEQPGQPGVVFFGALFPGITPADGTLVVRVIHTADQFIQGVTFVELPLAHSQLPSFGDYWSGTLSISVTAPPAGSKGWGGIDSDQYVYRFALKQPNGVYIDNIIDPFAREFGYGDLPAITVGDTAFAFDPTAEQGFKVPNIKDAIVYELNIEEFGGDLPKTIGMLPYLADLGINVIEVMPVCNTAERVDWGYDPVGHFGVASRLGRAADFQLLVQEAHRLNIAVVLDCVYGHVADGFAYWSLYSALNKPNPFIGPFAEDQMMHSTDFSQSLTQNYYYTNNVHWLEAYHIDGFRFDDVAEYWDQTRLIGSQGYSDMVAANLAYVSAQCAANPDYQRFVPKGGGEIALLQIAEFLGTNNPFLTSPPDPAQHVLYDTVSVSTWQNDTMNAAKNCARGYSGAIEAFGNQLGLVGYPVSLVQNGASITKSALQYLETHDHERFICSFGIHYPDEFSSDTNHPDPILQVGNRLTYNSDAPYAVVPEQSLWYKVQPYLIGLLTAKGTPLLWQGQEICQNYFVPDDGNDGARTVIYRPVNWNYFYDPVGKSLVNLVRTLTKIRSSGSQFRDGDHFFYSDGGSYNAYISQGLMLFHRSLGNTFSMVALNFTDVDVATSITLPISGNYIDQLDATRNLNGVVANTSVNVVVPSNYGCIWTN